MKPVRKLKVRRVLDDGPAKQDTFRVQLDAIMNRLNKTSASEAAQGLVGDGFRHLLDMTGSQIARMARDLSPTGLLMLIEALATEVRRMNQLAADAQDMVNGPNAVHDQTAGEARDIVGLSKLGMPGAASVVDVRAAADEVARVLSIVVDEHERRAREAPHDDGRILDPDQPAQLQPFARNANNAMTLDQLEAWGRSQAAMRARLTGESDVTGALGISKQAQQHDREVSKTRGCGLPLDSYAGAHQPVAARIRRP